MTCSTSRANHAEQMARQLRRRARKGCGVCLGEGEVTKSPPRAIFSGFGPLRVKNFLGNVLLARTQCSDNGLNLYDLRGGVGRPETNHSSEVTAVD